jgi:hypothetical protein
MSKASEPNGNQPVHSVRHRSLKATVWRNETRTGPMYNVTLVRSYKEGEEWHDTHSLGYDDLMNAAKLLYDAHSFITAQRASEGRPAAKPATRAPSRQAS